MKNTKSYLRAIGNLTETPTTTSSTETGTETGTVTDPALGFVYRSAAVDGFGKPGKSAAAAAITLTTQGEMCI